MFALAIRYLNGWAMAATDGANKRQAEWPPHPDRVFMALAAAWFETGEDPAEGAALRWLEALPDPAMAASSHAVRTLTIHYAPVNDAKTSPKIPSGADLKKLKNAGLAVLPEFRSRQPRTFPVAIPHDPVVHLIWQPPLDQPLDAHRAALDSLLAKLTHVGHSASLVQGWLELDNAPPPTLRPARGVDARKLRVPSAGRLAYLRRRLNRAAWLDYHDLQAQIARVKVNLKALNDAAKRAPRAAWADFPDVYLIANEREVKQHPHYWAAKAGDAEAAAALIAAWVDDAALARVRQFVQTLPDAAGLVMVSAHAYEQSGVNAIPAALAESLSARLGLSYQPGLAQINVVRRTGVDGYGRMAWQACFDGPIDAGKTYLLIDDFVGQGGTLANLRGYILKRKARVAGAICLTGKPYSAKVSLASDQLTALQDTHGATLERWWQGFFGHPFDCLTQSEARYLARSPDADRIRTQIVAASGAGSDLGFTGQAGSERQRLKALEQQLAEQFPQGCPVSLRPEPGRWASYLPVEPTLAAAVPGSLFDRRFIVFTLTGRRYALPAALQLTAALRGLLLKHCGQQPPPAWFSGHRADGGPTDQPHMALLPLPFVDAEHADGRIMGLGVALPAGLDPAAVDDCLGPIVLDPETGFARRHRLFKGRWLECGLETVLHERPPQSLRRTAWTAASRIWASVTPVVLDRHYDGADKWARAAADLRIGCARIGLPEPERVWLHSASSVRGVPPAQAFPYLTHQGGGRRYHAHAVLVFAQPVAGPVLLGAGRFRGYGLCRPLSERALSSCAEERGHG